MSGVDKRVSTVRIRETAIGHCPGHRCVGSARLAAPETPRKTRGSRPARTRSGSRTSNGPCSYIAGIVGVIVFAVVVYVVVRVPRPWPGDAGADARQAGARDRPHHPSGAHPHRCRHPHRQHRVRAGQDQRHECVINVTGQQWWWEYDYPVQNCGGVEIAEPLVTSGELVIPTTGRRAAAHHQQRRDPLVLDPEAQRQARRCARSHPPVADAGRRARHLRRSVHRVLRAQPRPHAHGCGRLDSGDFSTWVANQLEPAAQADRRVGRCRAKTPSAAQCARCHQVNGLTEENADGTKP